MGRADNIIPVEDAYAAHKARPDARLEVLPHVGHYPQVEAPNEAVELIEDFIASEGRRDVDSPQQSSSSGPHPATGLGG